MDKDLLKKGALEFGVDLSERQIDQFAEFENLLYAKNEQINLTRIPRENAVILHFLDSLTCASACDFSTVHTIIDVGTGAGFPGIPLKIAFPEISVLLLDSLQKRVNFLNDVISALQLHSISAVHQRAEHAARENLHREKYDLVVARALAPLEDLIELLLPFAKVGGTVLAMKSERLSTELVSARAALESLHCEIERVQPIALPGTSERNLVIIKKRRPTPEIYPRMRKKKPAKNRPAAASERGRRQ